jgi:hypothetical protein
MKIKNMMPVLVLLLVFLVGSACERKVVNEVSNDQSSLTSCFTCHSDQDVALTQARQQYDESGHAEGTTIDRNRNYSSRYQSCERCHTHEGFVARVTDVAYAGGNFSEISCFTCHSPHTSGSLALRVTSSVTLSNNEAYDIGKGNLCGSCHISRRDIDTYVVDNDTLSNHYGPHHGPQTDMLVGDNAYEYTGYTGYAGTGGYPNSYHAGGVTDGCVECHMATTLHTTGGHTFEVANEEDEYGNVMGCNVTGCHSGNPLDSLNRVALVDYDWNGSIEGIQSEIMGLLDSLETLLFADNLLEWIYEDGDSLAEPKDDRPVVLADTSGAVFNYMFVTEDRSKGVHNTAYAVDLLVSSINFLNSGDPNGAPKIPGGTELTLMTSH